MASDMVLRHTLQLIQYLSPAIIIVYFFIANVVSIVTLQTLDAHMAPRLRKTVFGGLFCLFLLYIAQAGLVVGLIFTNPGMYGSDPTNLHALASALVWLIISSSLMSFDDCTWYPFYGSWLIELGSEIIILALELAARRPGDGVEYALVSVQGSTCLLLVFLTALFFAWRKIDADPKAKDEERAPLLQAEGAATEVSGNDGAQESSDANGGDETGKKDGDGEDSDSDSDNDESDDEDAEDWWAKKKRKGNDQMKKRLKEEGGWYGYLKGFSVFLPYIWPARSLRLKCHLFGVVLCMLIERVLRPLQPTQLGYVVNALTSGSPSSAFRALAIYILIDAAQTNISTVRRYLWMPLETNTSNQMDKASYNHIMELSCDFHDSKQTGEVFEAMRQGHSVVDLIETLAFDLLPDVADLFIACFYFYYLFGPYLTLMGIATGVFYAVLSAWTTSRSSHIRRRMLKAWRKKSQIKYDTVPNWKTVSYFNRVPYSKKQYGEAIDKSNDMWLAYKLFSSVMQTLQSTAMDIGQFGAMAMAVWNIMYNGATPGSFVTLNNYWSSITSPLIGLSHTSSSLLFDLIDAEALLKIWKQKPGVHDGEMHLVLNPGKEGHVLFENVSFKYGKKGTIEDISFEAKPGETIALVGETGAGKSTILKLLFRFYDVTEGRILIDDQDIRHVTLESLHENIGVVPQDPALFNTNIIENLRYARLDATDEEIYDACRAAAVHDKIMTFRKGYQSKVGERGVKLSGGELQRVAIARAMLKKPPIVLLDEATSSVDSETEAKIQEGLKRLCHNRTTFVVAHRLSTIQHANRILVIKDGKIEEAGTPGELLDKKGKYYKLWTKQMGIFDPFAPKKDKKDGSDSDQSTVGGNDGDLIDLNDSRKDDVVGDDSKPAAEQKGDSKPRLELDTKTTLKSGPSSGTAVSSSPSKSPFRPDAPEFVPRNRRTESQSEDDAIATGPPGSNGALPGGILSSNVSGQASNPRRSHSRTNSQGESGTAPTSRPASRPGSSAETDGPGLLALQQAMTGASSQSQDGSSDSKR